MPARVYTRNPASGDRAIGGCQALCKVKTLSARILLSPTLFVLFSAALLSGHSAGFTEKTFSKADPFTSVAVLVGNDTKKPEAYDDQVPGASPSVAAALLRSPATFPLTTPPVLRHIFPETLARAPPLS